MRIMCSYLAQFKQYWRPGSGKGNTQIKKPGFEIQRDFFATRTKVLSGPKTFSNKTVTNRREILPGSSESGGRRLDGPTRRF